MAPAKAVQGLEDWDALRWMRGQERLKVAEGILEGVLAFSQRGFGRVFELQAMA